MENLNGVRGENVESVYPEPGQQPVPLDRSFSEHSVPTVLAIIAFGLGILALAFAAVTFIIPVLGLGVLLLIVAGLIAWRIHRVRYMHEHNIPM